MHNIEIMVEPRYIAEQSNMMKDRYVFSYHIVIVNRGEETVTLRRRYWEITDAHGGVEKVAGTGVVGEQPTLYPGEDFTYSSGAYLSTPWGSMQGRYEFENDSGSCFWVPIPRFDLKSDVILQ